MWIGYIGILQVRNFPPFPKVSDGLIQFALYIDLQAMVTGRKNTRTANVTPLCTLQNARKMQVDRAKHKLKKMFRPKFYGAKSNVQTRG